ncbi:hypothetical protein QZH41_019973, partial [Actinostola sp. cb2023]
LLLLLTGNIKDVLKDYSTLTKTDIHDVVTRRDAEGLEDKLVSFNTLGRNFLLHLSPNEGLFSENFKAYSIESEGKEEDIFVDKLSFYKGYVEGEESHARVHLQDGLMTASIVTQNETYIIEPSWRHLENSNQDEMIAYRHSDVKFNFTSDNPKNGQKKFSFCGHKSPPNINYGDSKDHNHDHTHRSRRASLPTKLRCPLVLVADYRFYENMGQKSKENTVNYMIGVADRVDRIYKSTTWRRGYGNYGFEIEQVIVHKTPTATSGLSRHYNMKLDLWDIKKLLEVFSYEKDWKKYCLAHLFTYQDFSDGVIGLAYVGSPRRTAVGGICTEDYRSGGRTLYLNTGLSSSVNWKRRVLTEEADIVTAHGCPGHNFGSEHDPDNAECAPSERSGGKFIMYPASVSGQRSNNKLFSPCSKRQIASVLVSKSHCFTVPREKICGNYKKEPGEECDPGNLGTIPTACCTTDCKLKVNAQCSDGYDSPCCKNCKYAKGEVCRREDPNFCHGETKCRDRDIACPVSPHLPDNTTCIERGKCRSGKCVEFCVAEGLEPCLCTTAAYACNVCCKKVNATTCSPWMNITSAETITILDGRPCTSGSCRQDKRNEKAETKEQEWRDPK